MLYEKEKSLAEETSKFKNEEEAIDEQIVMTETQIHELKKRIIAVESEVALAEHQCKMTAERHQLESSIKTKFNATDLLAKQNIHKSKEKSSSLKQSE